MADTVRIYRDLTEARTDFGPCALTIGNFDGVHAGHRRILRRVAAVAAERGLRPSALLFEPHPARVVAPERAPRLMTTPEERCELMGGEGIRQALILPFDRGIAALSPADFMREILADALGARVVLVGDNFRFGSGAAGTTGTLAGGGRSLGFDVEAVPAVKVRGRRVSSSAIRQEIEAGRVHRAGRMLERPFWLQGGVVRGHGVGAKQTVPTLNLNTRAEVLPKTGVYVTRTLDLDGGSRWPSVTNVGYRPTFGGDALSIETFLLSALDGAPPARIRVEFLRFLRDERAFESPEALKAQILRDAARARRYLDRIAKL
jgi:riboflavin kinase/FMN adenylyltransferase